MCCFVASVIKKSIPSILLVTNEQRQVPALSYTKTHLPFEYVYSLPLFLNIEPTISVQIKLKMFEASLSFFMQIEVSLCQGKLDELLCTHY